VIDRSLKHFNIWWLLFCNATCIDNIWHGLRQIHLQTGFWLNRTFFRREASEQCQRRSSEERMSPGCTPGTHHLPLKPAVQVILESGAVEWNDALLASQVWPWDRDICWIEGNID
jgi:hypothetical protein